MASSDFITRFDQAKRDLTVIRNGPSYGRMANDPNTKRALLEAFDVAQRWVIRVDRSGAAQSLEDSTLSAITGFVGRIVGIVDGREPVPSNSHSDALRVARQNFLSNAPLLALDFLEVTKVLDINAELIEKKSSTLSEIDNSMKSSLGQIDTQAGAYSNDLHVTANSLMDEIKNTAAEAVKDYELAKEKASQISVSAAQSQFISAEQRLRNRWFFWLTLSTLFFAALIFGLVWLFNHPPLIIGDIEDALRPGSKNALPPVPFSLLLAASAYFTSVRLALIGVLSVGFAVSIRMMRAYIHMREHNEHKLRVTNSIEAFVAAVRTKEQKDLVLSKLVESVTEFGDSGILGKQSESTSLPSIVLEAITKNVGKSE